MLNSNLIDLALNNKANPVFSIFLMKNNFDYKDQTEVIRSDATSEQLDSEKVLNKYDIIDADGETVEVLDVAALCSQQRYEHAMSGPQLQIELHDVAHVSADDDRVFSHLDDGIAHVTNFPFGPSGEFLGTGNDDRIILVSKKFHAVYLLTFLIRLQNVSIGTQRHQHVEELHRAPDDGRRMTVVQFDLHLVVVNRLQGIHHVRRIEHNLDFLSYVLDRHFVAGGTDFVRGRRNGQAVGLEDELR